MNIDTGNLDIDSVYDTIFKNEPTLKLKLKPWLYKFVRWIKQQQQVDEVRIITRFPNED